MLAVTQPFMVLSCECMVALVASTPTAVSGQGSKSQPWSSAPMSEMAKTWCPSCPQRSSLNISRT